MRWRHLRPTGGVWLQACLELSILGPDDLNGQPNEHTFHSCSVPCCYRLIRLLAACSDVCEGKMTDGVVRLLRVIAGFSVSISSVIRIPSPTVHRATHRKITQLQTKKKHYPSSLRQLHNMLGKRVGCIEQLVNAPDMSWSA